MTEQAYQLPENLVPENFFCARVYIPDEPEYRRAFLGAYMYLSKWLAWERDENHSASIAASVWRDAVDLTMDDWEKGCGIMAMTCEEIQECVNGLDLSGLVTVINNISCGGDGFIVIDEPGGDPIINPPPVGETPPEPVITPPVDVDIPDDPVDVGSGDPPAGFDTWAEYDAGACAAANALVEFMYQSALRLALFSSVESGILSKIVLFLSSVFSGVWSGFFVPAMLIRLAESIYSLMQVENIGILFAAVASYIETNRQELVCDLYKTRGDSAGWENWLVDKVATATASTLEYANSSSMWLTTLTWLVPSNLGAQMLFGGDDYPVTAPVTCDCVQNDGVWEFVLNGDNVQLVDGWNTPERLSYSASGERNSSFSSGYVRAKLDFDPTLAYPTPMKITVLQDDRSEGAGVPKATLTKGVGIFVSETELVLGDNFIAIDVVGINQISIKTVIDRNFSGVQTMQFDCTLQYWQEEV